MDFLDTTTFKGPDFEKTRHLDIKVFFKPTDTHALLHRTSHHPTHTFQGLVRSQILRFKRICTQASDFEVATKILFSALRKRAYTRTLLRKCFKTYAIRNTQPNVPVIPLVTSLSSSEQKMSRVFRNNFKVGLGQNPYFQPYKLITAYKRSPNLKDILVRAKVPTPRNCTKTSIQHLFKQHKFVQNLKNKQVFPVEPTGHIHSHNCVYLISCKLCQTRFLGVPKKALISVLCQYRFQSYAQSPKVGIPVPVLCPKS